MDQQDREDLAQLNSSAAEMLRLLNTRGGIRGGNNHMTFQVNAGGIGVWICVTCCLMMLSACIVGSVIGNSWMSSEFSHINHDLKDRKDENDAMKSYLSAIYMLAPQLKPKEEKDNGSRSDHHSDSTSAR